MTKVKMKRERYQLLFNLWFLHSWDMKFFVKRTAGLSHTLKITTFIQI